MRGRLAIDLQVPNGGLIANVPPHLVPPNGALPGSSNIYVDLDGLCKTRQGYGLIAPLNPTDRPMGLISYFDAGGNYQVIVGGLTTWQLYNGAGPSFTNITGTPNAGSADQPVRFAVLPNAGNVWVYGCNGAGNDPIRQWHVGIGGGVYTTNNGANSPSSCADMAVLNNRLVVINTVEGGTNYFYRVRWSAINDGQTWPAGAIADLVDHTEANIAIINTSRTSAIIYRPSSAWIINAIGGGSDSYSYSFERLPAADNLNGPGNPAAVVTAEGLQYYMGNDGRIYMFDGTAIYPISDPIDAAFGPIFDAGFASRVNGTYLPSKRQLWFFAPIVGSSSDPNTGVCFNITRQVFEPLATFNDFISCANVVQETTGVTWNNWVPANTSWPQVPYASWDSIPSGKELSAWVGLTNGNMCRFFTATTDNGVAIPYTLVGPMIRKSSREDLNFTHFELFLEQAVQPESIAAIIQGLFQPLYPSPVNLINVLMELSNASTFNVRLTPGNLNTGPGLAAAATLHTNLVQLIITSAGNNAGFVMAGGTLFGDPCERGDYLTGLGASPDPPQPGPD